MVETVILFAISVNDYHALYEFADAIKLPKWFNGVIKLPKRIKAIEAPELGDNNKYWGVLYTGRKPSKADITKTLVDAGYHPLGEDI